MYLKLKWSLAYGLKGYFDPIRRRLGLASSETCGHKKASKSIPIQSVANPFASGRFLPFIALGLALGASLPVQSAIGIETLGFNEHTFRGVNRIPHHDEYYSMSEFNGRDMTRSKWSGHAGKLLHPSYTQDADGIVILETFPRRYREVEPFAETYIVFEGIPSSGPILRLSSPIKGTPIRRLPRSFPRNAANPNISAVPLPSTLPLMALALAGIGFVARKKRGTDA